MSWYLAVLKNYAGFSGRARRKEYWMFFLFNFIAIILLDVIGAILDLGTYPAFVYLIAVLIPGIAVSVRRLHDIGHSWWWMLIGFVPLIGTIVLLFYMTIEGEPGDNAYGQPQSDW